MGKNNNNQELNNGAVNNAAPSSETKKETVKLIVDKQSASVAVDGITKITLNTDAEKISASANKDGKCLVSVEKNVVSIKGVIVGSTDITILGESKDKDSTNIVIPVSVSEKILESTKIVPNHSSISLKKGETKEIKLETDATELNVKVENNNTHIKANIDINRKIVFIRGEEITLGNIIISGKAPNANESYIKIPVTVEANSTIQPSKEIEGDRIITKESAAAEFVKRFTSFENTVGLTLARVVVVEVWDRLGYGRRKSNYIMKNLIHDIIGRKIGSTKFVNTEYAKSAIALVANLKQEEYGEVVSDVKKMDIIRKFLDGNNLSY